MKKIRIDIYDQEVMLFSSRKDFEKWMKKNPIREMEEMHQHIRQASGLAGMVCEAESEEARWFIYIEEYDLSVLSHEAVHISMMMLGVLGIEIDAANHEALAYLQGYIFKECANKLKLPTLFTDE